MSAQHTPGRQCDVCEGFCLKGHKHHTPGPWRFNEATQTIVSNQSHPVARLTEPFHRQCANGQTGNDGPLIAAAPDLLEALQSARCCVKDGSAVARRIDAAIAKATGSDA